MAISQKLTANRAVCSATVRARRCIMCRAANLSNSVSQPQSQVLAGPLGLTTSLPLVFPALSFAEEAASAMAPETTSIAADAATAAAETPAINEALQLALVLGPIVLYGGFNVYRSKLNPRATFTDFMFLVAAFVVLGNIFSIVVFKTRFF